MADKQYFFSGDIRDNQVFLDPVESKHCIRVLRHKSGDRIEVLDGQGHIYDCMITETSASGTRLEIVRQSDIPFPEENRIHIAIGPTKNLNRFEFFLEKVTELGVEEITPLITTYGERSFFRLERLYKILRSAIKQSRQAWLPKLNTPIPFDEFIRHPHEGNSFIAHGPDNTAGPLAGQRLRHSRSVILIGPEGGFSEDEVRNAEAHHYIPVNLGKSRLRTETAGIIAVAALHFIHSYTNE